MTIAAFLKDAQARLEAAGIATARLDCLILLEDALKLNRAAILAHLDREIDSLPLLELNKKIAQRMQHMPLAYIRNIAFFYGRPFYVDRHVLVPRPESEAMISLLKQLALPAMPRIADIGCGSGCLGITAALETHAVVHFYDISPDALKIAKRNARTHKVRGQYYEQNLLEHSWGPYDVILANLPYVPIKHAVNRAATYEPHVALFADDDGLALIRTFWKQVASDHPTYVITESFPFQHEQNAAFAKIAGYTIHTTDDFAQCFVTVS